MNEKKRPEILDALAFAALSGTALIGRLAHLYIGAEFGIKRELGKRARNAYIADEKNVAKWMRPVYTPPFGKVREMVVLVVGEVARQKTIQVNRGGARAYTVTYSKKGEKSSRRNELAAKLYQIKAREWNEREATVKRPSCSVMLTVGEHLIAYEGGTYGSPAILFTLNRRTGTSQLVKLSDAFSLDGMDLPAILLKMAPPEVRVAVFTGTPIVADFDRLSFLLGNEPKIVPFSVEGAPVISTGFKPPVYENH
jgi:hypothetical protein